MTEKLFNWQQKGWPKATVNRAIAALVKAGKVEHRGNKKTGGYYVRED